MALLKNIAIIISYGFVLLYFVLGIIYLFQLSKQLYKKRKK